MKLGKRATIKEIVEYGLDNIEENQAITIGARDFMYIHQVLAEYVRFFHNPMHYPTLDAVNQFSGDRSSGGGFEVLSTAVYEKLRWVKLPENIERMIDKGEFENPNPPEYY